MRILTFLSIALLCASCAVTDVKKTDARPAGASYATDSVIPGKGFERVRLPPVSDH
jgi:hypothetical protein